MSVDGTTALVECLEMRSGIDQLVEQIRSLQSELEAELAVRRVNLNYTLHSGRARFEQEVLRAHLALRVNLARYVFNANVMHIVTAPVIYSLIIPFVLLDIFVTVYQAVCFPVYGIEKVKRSDYLIFDRYHLAYLNLLEKMNCAYCSYCNGLLAYAREIAGRTEQYWCPIKHARRVIASYENYDRFAEYGDADAFRKRNERSP
jgi:hypothetical protein